MAELVLLHQVYTAKITIQSPNSSYKSQANTIWERNCLATYCYKIRAHCTMVGSINGCIYPTLVEYIQPKQLFYKPFMNKNRFLVNTLSKGLQIIFASLQPTTYCYQVPTYYPVMNTSNVTSTIQIHICNDITNLQFLSKVLKSLIRIPIKNQTICIP